MADLPRIVERVKAGAGLTADTQQTIREIVSQEVASLLADVASYLSHRARREVELLEDLATYLERRSMGEPADLEGLEAEEPPEPEAHQHQCPACGRMWEHGAGECGNPREEMACGCIREGGP